MCVLGGRLLTYNSYTVNNKQYCTKDIMCSNETCPLYRIYCLSGSNISDTNCDPFWLNNDIQIKKVI